MASSLFTRLRSPCCSSIFQPLSPRARCPAVTVVPADKGFGKEIVDDLGDVR